jgi:hypothetical protein
MVEVIGITASVTGLLSSLAKICQAIDGIRNAPSDARAVSWWGEVRTLNSTLTVFQGNLTRPGFTPSTQWAEASRMLIGNMEDVTVDLHRVLGEGRLAGVCGCERHGR